MRKLFLVVFCLLTINIVRAQLSGVKNIPGDYPDLASAIASLNTLGAGSGGVVFNLLTGQPQTAPAGGYVIGGTSSALLTTTSPTNTVVINGNGNIITASAGQTAGSLNDAIFKLIGADNVTINNFTLQENALNATMTPATNTMTEFGIALFYASVSDGARRDIIKNNSIQLNRLYSNSIGIYSNRFHNATSMTAAASGTAGTGSNDSLKITGNAISNVNYGIVTAGGNANEIGGSTAADGNTITNWGGTPLGSAFVSVSGNSCGIYAHQETDNTIANNSITAASGLVTGAMPLTAIQNVVPATVTAASCNVNINANNIAVNTSPTTGAVTGIMISGTGTNSTIVNVNGNTITGSIGGTATSADFTGIDALASVGQLIINGNTVKGVTTMATTGGFSGIQLRTNPVALAATIKNNKIGIASSPAVTFSNTSNAGTAKGVAIEASGVSSGSGLYITGNDFQGFNHTATGSGAHSYIRVVTACFSEVVSNNTFTGLSDNTTGSVTFITNSNFVVNGGNSTINGNAIVNSYAKTAAGGAVSFLNQSGTAVGITEIHRNNSFSNVSVVGATAINAWISADGQATQGSVKYVDSNSFQNITAGSGAITLMTINNTTTNVLTNSANANVFKNISSGGAITGISATSGCLGFQNNSFISLSTSGAAAINCFVITGGNVQRMLGSKVVDIECTNPSGTINVFSVSTATSSHVANSIVGDLRAPSSNNPNAIIVVNLNVRTFVYNNTVYLNSTSTGANFGNSIVLLPANGNAVVQDNIFINTSVPAGTGKAVIIRGLSSNLSSYFGARNIFFTGAPSAGNLFFYDGTNSDQTLAAFKTRVAPNDATSEEENVVPNFVSTISTAAGYGHIIPGTATAAESKASGSVLPEVDFDNEPRFGFQGYAGTGTAPDAGADEFNGVPIGPKDIAVTALISPTASPCGASSPITIQLTNSGINPINFALTNVSIAVTVSGAGSGTFNYVLNSGILTAGATQNVIVSPSFPIQTAGTYQFTITATMPGDAVPANNSFSGTATVVAPFTLPQVVDFTGYTGTNLNTVFPGWSVGTGNITPVSGNSNWTAVAGLGGATNVTAQITMAPPSHADWIISPKFTATALSVLSYKIALTGAGNFSAITGGFQLDDRLFVSVSNDCGKSWTVLKDYNNSNSAYLSNTLITEAISLSDYAGQDIIVAFKAIQGSIAGPSFDLHLDDVNINNTPACAGAVGGTATATSTTACTSGSSMIYASGYSTGAGSTYQWQSSTNNTTFTDLPNQTSPAAAVTGTITATTYYRLKVTCASGTAIAYSNVVTITISPANFASMSPNQGPLSICAPATVTFSGTTTATSPSFQWLNNNSVIAGATSPTYVASQSGLYSLRVIDGFTGCQSTTFGVSLTVNPQPGAITVTPSAPIVCLGNIQQLTASVAASSVPYTLLWSPAAGLYSDAAATVPYTGANNNTVYVKPTANATFTVTATSSAGCTISTPVNVVIGGTPVITGQPTAQSVCVGSAATFSATATGAGVSYQWRKAGVNIAGATASTYTIPAVSAVDAANYDVVATTPCGSAVSVSVPLVINTVALTAQPVGLTACQGVANFSVGVTGTGLTYQWRFNGIAIAGATSSTLAVPVSAAAAGNYDVLINSPCGTLSSIAVALIVQNCTSISPVDATIGDAKLLPNVVQNTAILRVASTRSAKINWTIMDMNGRAVMQFDQVVANGQNDLKIVLGRLSAGTYQLTGVTERGRIATVRFTRL